jgi:hypothetical protein
MLRLLSGEHRSRRGRKVHHSYRMPYWHDGATLCNSSGSSNVRAHLGALYTHIYIAMRTLYQDLLCRFEYVTLLQCARTAAHCITRYCMCQSV